MQLPSPIHQINFRGQNIYLKRDDLIDPFVSGNKWRKLKYTIAKAQSLGKSHLVTFGGAFSNHLLATAAATAKLGFKSTAFVRGEEVHNPMLTLCKLYGMELDFTDRTLYRDKQNLYEQNYRNNPLTYFVNEGGASEEGVQGCTEIITELREEFDHIICAAGTGTTAAGILRAINQKQLNTQLHVVPVLKGGAFIRNEIVQYEQDLTKLHLHLDYHFGGYAKTPPDILNFIKEFTSKTGVLIDPIYTAKMCFALFDLLSKNTIPKSSKILAVHTGGMHGILGKIDKFH